jgi:hypothetical protein
MSQLMEPNKVEGHIIAPATPVEPIKEENTIRLTAEGQVRLAQLLESSRPLSTTMLQAKEASALLFDEPR